MLKIGLLGGTFDPVHNGHLQLGNRVLKDFGFDRILFIPAAHPPHKNEAFVCDVSHRLKMLNLAIGSSQQFELSEIEISRKDVSYTYDTIQELKQNNHSRARYHFIIGFDALFEIETWYRWKDLLAATNFIVAVRPGFSLKQIRKLLERNGFVHDEGKTNRWIGQQSGNEILFLTSEIADISSTDIRNRINARQPWEDFVPPGVADYIIRNRLYL